MSEEEYNPTNEELLAVLQDKDLLDGEGYRILPKGHMAMVLMEMGVPHDGAEMIAQVMSDRIFLDGWIFLQESQLKVADD